VRIKSKLSVAYVLDTGDTPVAPMRDWEQRVPGAHLRGGNLSQIDAMTARNPRSVEVDELLLNARLREELEPFMDE